MTTETPSAQAAASAGPVLYQVADGVASIVFNRPEAYNAVDLPMGRALTAALAQAAADDSVRVVVLSGRGRSFGAGGDVKAMAAAPDRAPFLLELATVAHEAILAITKLQVPVIAVVQGVAAGAGLALTLASDLVLVGESARFLTAYTAIGLTPDCGTSWLLPAIVGQRRALELTLTGRVLSAAEAVDWGLVTRAVPDDDLVQAADELARTIAAGPNPALGMTRRLIRDSSDRTLKEQLDVEAQAISDVSRSAETRDLIEAFGRKANR
jgi:2-(1,2-epoxy-1,2-dihydrophenyl)acetyl-CoA isomerase